MSPNETPSGPIPIPISAKSPPFVARSATGIRGQWFQSPSPSSTLNLQRGSETLNPTFVRMLADACRSGDVHAVKGLVSGFDNLLDVLSQAPFPVHLAARKGQLAIMRVFLEQTRNAAAFVRNDEGETPVHCAVEAGSLPLVHLLCERADIVPFVGSSQAPLDGTDVALGTGRSNHTDPAQTGTSALASSLASQGTSTAASLAAQADRDGWTPLMVAASKGYLDIVAYLVEEMHTDVDAQSRHGFTALMNACSKGSLPVVQYLLKHGADALVCNAWDETAFDVAALVFEVHICSLLALFEAFLVANREVDKELNLLQWHSCIPILIFENQRYVGGHWIPDAHIPSTPASLLDQQTLPEHMPPLGYYTEPHVVPGEDVLAREDIGLPQDEFSGVLPLHCPEDAPDPLVAQLRTASIGGSDSSTLGDAPIVGSLDSESTFTVSSTTPPWFWFSEWTIDLTSPHASPGDGWSYAPALDTPADQWSPDVPAAIPDLSTRRRRWLRLLKRRPASLSAPLGYVERAKLSSGLSAGSPTPTAVHEQELSIVDIRKQRVRLSRAVAILRAGIASDSHASHRANALLLLDTYQAKLSALTASLPREPQDNDSRNDSFTTEIQDDAAHGDDTANASGASAHTESSASSAHTAYAVPSRERPVHAHGSSANTVASSAAVTSSLPAAPVAAWEPDESSHECRRCKRPFTFYRRRHHCRACGQLVCSACSQMDVLEPYQIVCPPGEVAFLAQRLRTCTACHGRLQAIPGPANPMSVPSSRSLVSETSLVECPVCAQPLDAIGAPAQQQAHIAACLAANSGAIAKALSTRYVPFDLLDGPALDEECKICFEDFVRGDRLARLPCLCYFHAKCIKAWIDRGHACPIHAVREV